MTISAGKFEILSLGRKPDFDYRVFGQLVDKGRDAFEKAMERKDTFEKEMNEFVLNAAAPTLASLGHEASKRRVERAEKHGVVGLAEKLAKNYRVENFAFGSSMSDLTQNVVSKPGKKVGIGNVSLRDSFSRHAGLVKKDMLAMHPEKLQKQLENEKVDLRKGSLVLLAHEIAKMSVIHHRMTQSGGDLYREYGKVNKRIRHLVEIGQALINGEFSDETMRGGVAALERAVKDKSNKRARALMVFGMAVGSSVLAACGSSAEAAPAATQEAENPVVNTPVLEPTKAIEATPISIVIPESTATGAFVEVAVGEPIPSIDFIQLPDYVPENFTPVMDPEVADQVMDLRDHGLSVLRNGGYVAYQDADGVEYYPSLDEITDESGDHTLIKGSMNEKGVVEYASKNGVVVEHHLLSFDCPDNELCYEALSFNEEDQGILYLVRLDKKTGKVIGYVNTGVAGKAVMEGKDIPWQLGESEYWQSSVSGEAALQRGEVKALAYESGVLTFLDSTGEKHVVDDVDISFYPGFGTIVTDNNGWYMWNDISDEWVLMSQADSYGETQLSNGEVLYNVDGRYVIADENNYYWVNGVEEGGKLVVLTENGKKWEWDGNMGWIESFTDAQLEWKNLFEKNGYTFSNEQVVAPNGVVVEGLHMEGDTLVMSYAFPELGGDKIDVTLTDDGIRFGYNLALDTIKFKADGTLDMPGLRFDGEQVVQKKVLYNGKENNETLLPIEVVIELIRRDTAAFVEKYGDSVLEPDSEMRAESGERWRDLTNISSLSVRKVSFKGMTFTRAVDGVYDSRIYMVNNDAIEATIEEIPTTFYAYQEFTDGQSMVTWENVNGEQVWYMVDGFLGNIQFFNKNKLTPFVVDSIE